MKRIAAILLIFLYLIPAIGVAISAHHCGGKVTSVSLQLLDLGHKCPCGKKRPMKKDCCKDEVKFFKLKAEQQKVHQHAHKVFKTITILSALTDNFTFCYELPLVLKDFLTADHPPNKIKQPLYIRHRVFRI